MSLNEQIRRYTESLNAQGLLRTRELRHINRIEFDSSDYLSLRQDERTSKAYINAFAQDPAGSGSSMMLSGYHLSHQALEQAIASVLDVDACLVFSSGYAANLAILSLLSKLKAHCFIDKGVHASIYDGIKLSRPLYTRFKHNDVPDLTRQLNAKASSYPVIMTEGIFSMSGQIAPLAELASIAKTHQAILIVDEAHSFGIMGPQGRGSVVQHGLSQDQVPLRLVGFGKAFAAQGAVVAGKKEWIEALLQAGRSLIYSTAISPALCSGLQSTLSIILNACDRRAHLAKLIACFRDQIATSTFTWANSTTPIQQLQLGCPHQTLYYAQALQRLGYYCSAIREPTVPARQSGLRILLNYRHQEEEIVNLFKVLSYISESVTTSSPESPRLDRGAH
jgi:8-amino-7-oxononanoate synthase